SAAREEVADTRPPGPRGLSDRDQAERSLELDRHRERGGRDRDREVVAGVDTVLDLRRRDEIRLIRRAVTTRLEDVGLAQDPHRVLGGGVGLEIVVEGVAAGELVLDLRDAAVLDLERVPRAV